MPLKEFTLITLNRILTWRQSTSHSPEDWLHIYREREILFYTDHLVSIILFNYDYLSSTAILLCLYFYSLYYNFVNLNFICNNNNLIVRLSFHFAYDTDEEIRDFEIYLSNISRMWYWCCFTLTPSYGFLIYVYIYGVHYRRILWSSYRKLAWVGFEPTTTNSFQTL